MLRRWAVPVLMVLGLGVADASAQETHFRVLAGASPAGNNSSDGGDGRRRAVQRSDRYRRR